MIAIDQPVARPVRAEAEEDDSGRHGIVADGIRRAVASHLTDVDIRQPVIAPRFLGDDLCKRAVDLSAMVRTAVEQIQAGDPEREVEWVVAPGMRVYADPGLLRQVLECLLRNAFRFSGAARQARIEVGSRRPLPGRIEVFVRDNGAGFDAHLAPTMLAPFRRFRDLAVPVGERIDLATARCIVERHGGFVKAEGSPGVGATFTLSLPDWSDFPVRDISAICAPSGQSPTGDLRRQPVESAGGYRSTRRITRMIDEATQFTLPANRALLAMALLACVAALLLAR